MVISFALHLVETTSELWAVLVELSKRARWLIVTAPHKKPDVGRAFSFEIEASTEICVHRSSPAGDGHVGTLRLAGVRPRGEGTSAELKETALRLCWTVCGCGRGGVR